MHCGNRRLKNVRLKNDDEANIWGTGRLAYVCGPRLCSVRDSYLAYHLKCSFLRFEFDNLSITHACSFVSHCGVYFSSPRSRRPPSVRRERKVRILTVSQPPRLSPPPRARRSRRFSCYVLRFRTTSRLTTSLWPLCYEPRPERGGGPIS